jgi:hypothetical protein
MTASPCHFEAFFKTSKCMYFFGPFYNIYSFSPFRPFFLPHFLPSIFLGGRILLQRPFQIGNVHREKLMEGKEEGKVTKK